MNIYINQKKDAITYALADDNFWIIFDLEPDYPQLAFSRLTPKSNHKVNID